MSISSTTARNNYVGNDVASEFAFQFKIFSANDLEVRTNDGTTETSLALTTNYTISLTDGSYPSAGTITLTAGALASGTKITLRRNTPLKQEVDIKNAGEYLPKTHEIALDKLTAMAQQQQDQLDRCLQVHITDAGTFDCVIPTTSRQAKAVLATNSSGTGVEWLPVTADGISNPSQNKTDAEAAQTAAAASATAAAASASAASTSEANCLTYKNYCAQVEANISVRVSSILTTDTTATTDLGLIRVDPSTTDLTITLPAASSAGDGKRFIIKNVTDSSNTITISPDGTDVIDDGTSATIEYPRGVISVVSDGSADWIVL
jgi:hypothetical protein